MRKRTKNTRYAVPVHHLSAYTKEQRDVSDRARLPRLPDTPLSQQFFEPCSQTINVKHPDVNDTQGNEPSAWMQCANQSIHRTDQSCRVCWHNKEFLEDPHNEAWKEAPNNSEWGSELEATTRELLSAAADNVDLRRRLGLERPTFEIDVRHLLTPRELQKKTKNTSVARYNLRPRPEPTKVKRVGDRRYKPKCKDVLTDIPLNIAYLYLLQWKKRIPDHVIELIQRERNFARTK